MGLEWPVKIPRACTRPADAVAAIEAIEAPLAVVRGDVDVRVGARIDPKAPDIEIESAGRGGECKQRQGQQARPAAHGHDVCPEERWVGSSVVSPRERRSLRAPKPCLRKCSLASGMSSGRGDG